MSNEYIPLLLNVDAWATSVFPPTHPVVGMRLQLEVYGVDNDGSVKCRLVVVGEKETP